ncbi:MAG: hypothetical protein MJA29_03305, partial [Candidatus Omnitrophica bacterium]|nr:hypothetical protein [Candidatus Omnitrophota bacterium]
RLAKKTVTRTLKFFGSWRLDRNKGLIFEVRNPKTPGQQFVFGAEVRVMNNTTIAFKLLLHQGKAKGVRIELKKEDLKNGREYFLKLIKETKDKAVLIGVHKPW